jgi:hypothetical protein
MSLGISILAVVISFASLYLGHRRYKRDTLLKLHEALIDTDLQEGRRIIFELYKVSGDVEDLSEADRASANRALSFFDVAGTYCYKRYVNRKAFIELWAPPLVRMKYAAETFIAYRDSFWPGTPAWPYYRRLTNDAEAYLKKQGVDISKPPPR